MQPGSLKGILFRKKRLVDMDAFTSLSRNDWVLEERRREGMHGATVPDMLGLFGERRELALAASSGNVIN
eukprot:7975756-Pyramimonas_sp.AAC.1